MSYYPYTASASSTNTTGVADAYEDGGAVHPPNFVPEASSNNVLPTLRSSPTIDNSSTFGAPQPEKTRNEPPLKGSRLSREPSDLRATIVEADLTDLVRCGGGGYGDVYRIHHSVLGDIALKRLREVGDQQYVTSERKRARKEAKIWYALEHPHVLKFLGLYETKIHFFFVSPYARNGTICLYLVDHPDADRLRLLSEAASGLAYLHDNRVIHGDVKAANVLISDDVHALICDFGLTRDFDTVTSTTRKGAGSVRWMSPEVLQNGGGRSPASDVWGFGMMTAEIISGNVPYAEILNDPRVIRAILQENRRPRQEPCFSTSGESYHETWRVAALCWDRDPDARPTMRSVHQQLITRAIRQRSLILRGADREVAAIAFSPDSSVVAAASWDRTIRLWAIATSSQIGAPLIGHRNWVCAVSFSPNGAWLVSGSLDTTLRLWDPRTGRSIGDEWRGHTEPVRSVTFSPDNQRVASGSFDCTVRVWDAVSATCISVLSDHSDWVNSVAYSPNGSILASASNDGTVILWDTETSEALSAPLRHRQWVWSVAFSPNSSTLASASGAGENTIHLWSIDPIQRQGGEIRGHEDGVRSVAFCQSRQLLASASVDRTVKLWDMKSVPPRALMTLVGHSNWTVSVMFSPDGNWIASGSYDRTVRLWNLDALLSGL